jgi:hypothetical protein
MIKGKTPEEIRKLFNIVNDFTPEEEVSRPYFYFAITLFNPIIKAQIKKENVSTTTLLPCITTSSFFFLYFLGMGGGSLS